MLRFLNSQLFVTPQIPADTDFNGQTVIVTGSNTGLGKEAVRHIVALHASKVIIAVRNIKAGEEARQDIIATTQCNSSIIEVWSLDLSSFDSVKAFASKASQLPRIDVLLENAGISTNAFSAAEGFERTLTVNVISTFLLAFLLLPKLKETAKAHKVEPRIVIVTSEMHGFVGWTPYDKEDIFAVISDQKTANMTERYPVSKLMEVLVVREIAPRLADSGVILNMLNPGFCHSELVRDSAVAKFFAGLMKILLARTTEVGSRCLVAGAAAGPESHGKYMTDARVEEDGLSYYVKSGASDEPGRRFWLQLKTTLEKISPGVTASL